MQRQSVDRKELARLAAASGAEVPQSALEPLAEYLEMLCQWNKAMNLVGPHTWQDMLTRLAMDSFHLAGFLDKLNLPEAPLCWDLGAGAGLPGIPLRMAWTRGAYYMIEVREKRALFISSVLSRLQLPSTHALDRSQPDPQMEALAQALAQWPGREAFPLAIVADDADFCAANLDNFLWVPFTRSDPATDVYGAQAATRARHWSCESPLVIDARLKPFHGLALKPLQIPRIGARQQGCVPRRLLAAQRRCRAAVLCAGRKAQADHQSRHKHGQQGQSGRKPGSPRHGPPQDFSQWLGTHCCDHQAFAAVSSALAVFHSSSFSSRVRAEKSRFFSRAISSMRAKRLRKRRLA